MKWAGWKGPQWAPGSTRVILEFIAQDCVNPCSWSQFPSPISFYPVWHQKEQQLPQETQHVQQDEMWFSFSSSFCNMLLTHQYTSFMPSFMSCFGSTSCSMTLYSTSVVLHPQAPIFHLALSSLQKPESQPTLYILMPQNGMHQLALTHATPTSAPGTPAPFPTDGFGHALPDE